MESISRRCCWLFCPALITFSSVALSAGPADPRLQSVPQSVAEQTPVAAFAALPEMRSPQLSPDGDRLLYLTPIDDTYHAALLDLKNAKRSLVMAADPDEFLINWCNWANNSRIVCSIRYYARLQAGQPDARTIRRYRDGRTTFTRMIAVDADGQNSLQLVPAPSNRQSGDVEWNAVDQDGVVSWLRDEPEHILIQLNREDRTRPTVYRLNVYNNRMKLIRRHHESVLRWYADQQGNLRYAVGYRETNPVAFTVDDKRRIRELDLSPIAADIDPTLLGLSGDGQLVYFASYHAGETRKLFSLPQTGEGDPTLVLEVDGYDFFGYLTFHPTRGNLLLAQYFTERNERHWFDAEQQARLDDVFRTLDNIHNSVRLLSMDQGLNRFIFSGQGNGTPPTYYFYDAAEKDLKLLAKTYKQLPEVIATEVVRYKTRDDYPIVAYLTRPPGDGPFPTVILPHGGPNVRDYPDFDYWSQFLVSRGYAVLQPNFRGSIGYGADHLRQGFEQWGLRMQDDVIDGLDWLIEQKITDPERVCVVGGSYGGYVALVAAFKTPEKLRCAVSFAGVTDLGHLKQHWRQYDLGELSLARVQSGSAVNQNSPLRQVEQIDVPLLIVHGDLDRSVMIEHSRRLVDELDAAAQPHRYIEQPGGDHFLSRQSQRTQFLEALDEFLAEHLSKNAATGS